MAMNLLTAVQANPNLPPQFKEVAISVANNAIVFANQELAKLPADQTPVQTPVQPVTVQPVQAPVVGGIITPMDKSEILVTETSHIKPNKTLTGFDGWSFRVSVLDKDGNYTRSTIVANIPDTFGDQNLIKEAGNQSGTNKGDWSADFSFYPKSKGQKTLTFTSGNLTKSIVVEVD